MATPRKRPEDKLKAGAPTKYDPKYCDLVIKLGKQGKQTSGLACAIGVTKSTLQEWASVHPAFSVAFAKSRQECEDFLINLATKKTKGQNPNGSDAMLKFLLSACHGLREKSDVSSTVDMTVKGKIELDFGAR